LKIPCNKVGIMLQISWKFCWQNT